MAIRCCLFAFIAVVSLSSVRRGTHGMALAKEDVAAQGTALDDYFKGKVVALDGKTVTLRYDFANDKQMADWETFVPFPLPPKKGAKAGWYDSKLEVSGTTGMRHRAQWVGDVVVDAQITPDAKQDIGAYMTPVSVSNDYVTFTLAEHFFHAWDKKAGGQHSIIQFGDQWTEPGSPPEYIGFRYISRRPPPKAEVITPGKTVRFTCKWEKKKLHMEAPGVSLKGKCLGKTLRDLQVGFYAIKARALVDNVTITGTLNPKWLKAQKLALRTSKPLQAKAVKGVGPVAQELLDKHAAGEGSALEGLLERIRGLEGTPVERKAIAKALGAGTRSAVRPSMGLLYHENAEVRTHAISIVKGLLGKNYGYKPKSKETQRSKAIKKMNEAIKKNPKLLKD